MYVQEDHFNEDGTKKSSYGTTTNQEWYDNILGAVEDKKLRNIGKKDIDNTMNQDYDFIIIFRDENDEPIRIFQFYNEMEFSVTEGNKIKYYRSVEISL